MNEEENKVASDPVGEVGKAVGSLKVIMEIAEKTPELRDAGRNVAKVAKTLTALVNNCLLPIAAVNFAFEKGRSYFSNKFTGDLAEAVKDVPPEYLSEPKASIAAPILQGLTFAHPEEELRNMFLNLLKTSMDSRVSRQAHPFFAEAIRQITAEEARLLAEILGAKSLPIIRILVYNGPPGAAARGFTNIGYEIFATHIASLTRTETEEPITVYGFSAMVENWIRLGFIEVTYREKLVSPDAYNWALKRPEYLEAVQNNNPNYVVMNNGIIRATPFGEQFGRAVL